MEIDERFVDKFIKKETVSLSEIMEQGAFIDKKVCYMRVVTEQYIASLSVRICQGRGDQLEHHYYQNKDSFTEINGKNIVRRKYADRHHLMV